jgi:5-methylcytosine-specific restriction endonuclease McrA
VVQYECSDAAAAIAPADSDGPRAVQKYLMDSVPILSAREVYQHPVNGESADDFIRSDDFDHLLDKVAGVFHITDDLKQKALMEEQLFQAQPLNAGSLKSSGCRIGDPPVPGSISGEEEDQKLMTDSYKTVQKVLKFCERSMFQVLEGLKPLCDIVARMSGDDNFFSELLSFHARVKIVNFRVSHQRIYMPDCLVRYTMEQDLLVGDQKQPAMPHRLEFWRTRRGMVPTGPCDSCGKSVTSENYERGHVVAARRKSVDGGTNNVHNLQILCQPCNAAMGTADAVLYTDRKGSPPPSYTTDGFFTVS